MQSEMLEKEYGRHRYPTLDSAAFLDSKVECQYGCGCTLDCGREYGPPGIDPRGTCPKNPMDGKFLDGEMSMGRDYRYVVEQRIRQLDNRAVAAERRLRLVSPGTRVLGRKLQQALQKLAQRDELIEEIRSLLRRTRKT